MSEERKKALEQALSQIEKKYGKGSVMRLGQKGGIGKIKVIPSGSLTLDIATGVGGLPKGRVIEIYGKESSGKTTVALSAIAEAQKAGGTAAFVDAEHALDINYAGIIGVDTEKLIVSQPSCGEESLNITEMLVRSNAVDLIVVDSVAALVPRAEIEGEMGDHIIGLHARLMSQALRKLASAVSKSHSIIIFINQTRDRIGIIYGAKTTTTGGHALKFYSSLRLETKRVEYLKDNKNVVVGCRVKVKVQKNKVAPPFKEAEFELYYASGISRIREIVDISVNLDIVHRAGAWYSYNEEKIGQGRESVLKYLIEHEDIKKEIENAILSIYKLNDESTEETTSQK